MVNDQVGGALRVDQVGVAAKIGHGVSHGSKVDHGGHAREVLQDHSGRL